MNLYGQLDCIIFEIGTIADRGRLKHGHELARLN